MAAGPGLANFLELRYGEVRILGILGSWPNNNALKRARFIAAC
jgi:hypothetical protein